MDSYLSLGFSWFGDNNCPFPLSVVRSKKNYEVKPLIGAN
jgi:hypothetical protein